MPSLSPTYYTPLPPDPFLINTPTFDNAGVAWGIQTGNEVAKATMIIGDPSYFPPTMSRKAGTVVRSICVLDHTIAGRLVLCFFLHCRCCGYCTLLVSSSPSSPPYNVHCHLHIDSTPTIYLLHPTGTSDAESVQIIIPASKVSQTPTPTPPSLSHPLVSPNSYSFISLILTLFPLLSPCNIIPVL